MNKKTLHIFFKDKDRSWKNNRYTAGISYSFLTVLLLCFFIPSTAETAPFMKLFMPGKVIAGHKKYEDKCSLCHKSFKKSLQRPLCLDCHKKVAKDISEKTGFHGLEQKVREKDCSDCHTEHEGRDFNIVTLDRDMFDHGMTDFRLEGSHKVLSCKVCHLKGKKFREAQKKCVDCHKEKDFHDGHLGEKCLDCHKVSTWRDLKFDHNKTKFKLEGKHEKVICTKCHPDKDYKKSPKVCFGCHKVNDVHGGKYSSKCEQCHTPIGWKKSLFNHKKVKNVGKVKISDCYACHKASDIHEGRFNADCKKCHKVDKWKPSIFDHGKAEFPLKGRHVKVECEACHTATLKYKKLKTACFDCHKQKDKHNGLYGTKCSDCHTPKAWKDLVFSHDTTKYKLEGKHVKVSCSLCHKEQLYKNKTKSKCNECHRFDDPHEDRYGVFCQACHTPEEWKKSVFDHKKAVLVSNIEKRVEQCALCYKERLGKGCFGCHKADDIHKGKEGELCEKCHFVESWNKKVFFDHDATHFPLIGMHAMVPCEECHLEPTYKGLEVDCDTCHKGEDKHEERLGPRCEKCHNPNGFNLWTFDHTKQTKFSLDGAHEGLECLSCHTEPVKKEFNQSKVCGSCHERENIHSGKYWQNCEKCHTTSSFEDIKLEG